MLVLKRRRAAHVALHVEHFKEALDPGPAGLGGEGAGHVQHRLPGVRMAAFRAGNLVA